jgi:predicted RNA binding protein YcfA (HicA-like mRNA interferase family)
MMPGEKRFSEVRRTLQRAGYRLVRIHGSHHYFTKPGQPPFSIPVHAGKVKPYYVREVEKVCQGQGN